MADNNYSFNSNSMNYEIIEIKGEKRFFITGHIATGEIDLLNEVVTENGMESMLNQIKQKSIKLDFDHEAFRENPTIIPVGKIIDARIDSKGLWIKAELNSASPKFKALWKSIKRGFVDAFSIAFKPIKTTMKTIDGVAVKLLDDLKLLNVALTGVPINQGARIENVMMKALNNMDEVKTMEEEKIKQMEADLKSIQDEKVAFEKEIADLKSGAEKLEAVEKENVDLKSKVEELEKAAVDAADLKSKEDEEKQDEAAKQMADLKSEIEKIKAMPILKSTIPAANDGVDQASEKPESIINNI